MVIFVDYGPCLHTGAGLGDMPEVRELERLGLRVTDGEGGDSRSGGDAGDVGETTMATTESGERVTTDPKHEATKGGVGKPFILSEGLPPVPQKLVARILRGEYIDMADLLRDNLEAQRRSASQSSGSSSMGVAPPARSRREIPDILSWVQCFGTYIAIVTSQNPERMRQLLAYQTLIVREARRCGGKGWLAYDSYFRQQAMGNSAADWSRINQSLYAVTFMAQSEREKGRCCMLCLESDHVDDQCALYTPPQKYKKAAERYPSEGREPMSSGRSRGRGRLACFAWNQGECRFPACKYRHVCVRCMGDHKIPQCPLLKGDKDNRPPRNHGGLPAEGR